jgi:hypothetical protein
MFSHDIHVNIGSCALGRFQTPVHVRMGKDERRVRLHEPYSPDVGIHWSAFPQCDKFAESDAAIWKREVQMSITSLSSQKQKSRRTIPLS